MKAGHARQMKWHENALPHRGGTIAFKYLLEGVEGSPENFSLILAREGSDFYSPRHRHAWDQIRFCLEGSVPIGPGVSIDAGEVGYFPEGVAYGPQEGSGERIVLVLQFGGASGGGYLSAAQVARGRAELAQHGTFEGGVFRRTSGYGPRNQDGYEAVWEHVFGRPVTYPKPRYRAPVVMSPEHFAWEDDGDWPGVERRFLGSFTERATRIEFVKIARASIVELGDKAAQLVVFVRHGAGRCGDVHIDEQSAVLLGAGEPARVTAEAELELLVVTLPLISQRRA